MLSSSHIPSERLDLLFDADDTLWENNIYFERAIAAFIAFLDHRAHSPQQVRDRLNVCEHETIALHGYGLQSFRRSLMRCFEQLAEVPITAEIHQKVASFANIIADAQIELLPDVVQTLAALKERHRLLIVTKGNPEEQLSKVDRSGLRDFFSAVEVLPEKTPEQYRRISQEHGCDPARTWMIGNAPRSDINPALAAGLNAAFIPHDFTWVLEHEVVEHPVDSARYLELKSFRELALHF